MVSFANLGFFAETTNALDCFFFVSFAIFCVFLLVCTPYLCINQTFVCKTKGVSLLYIEKNN